MRYVDIKDQVVRTTNNLEHIPVDIMQAVLDNYLGYWEWMNLWEVRHREHPSIHCLIHADMHGYGEHNCTVGTIVVDDIPAFFYVWTVTTDGNGQLVGDNRLYILSTTACKAFTTYIVNMAVEVALDTIEPEHEEVEVAKYIPALSTFSGGEVLYGEEYWYIKDKWVSSNKEDSNA